MKERSRSARRLQITAFTPRAKERPADLAAEGELDLQLVNFWPNMELEEYINLEQRVSGRMVLVDISATGEENVIEQQSGNQMNDLEYRRKQLLKLQDAVIDLEDLSSGISIADLTLNDFRIDLARVPKQRHERLETFPLRMFDVCTSPAGEDAVAPGAIFCLRAVGESARKPFEPGYPLAPHYLVHVGDDGEVLHGFAQAKTILDHLKRLCAERDHPDASACERFDRLTRTGENMRHYQKLLGAGIASVVGKKEERAVASLFAPGGTHAQKGEFAGINDFEVVAFVVILPESGAKAGRLRELVHRAIPYPVLLLSVLDEEVVFSLAHLRNAQNEAGKIVLDGEVEAIQVTAATMTEAFRCLSAEPRS